MSTVKKSPKNTPLPTAKKEVFFSAEERPGTLIIVE